MDEVTIIDEWCLTESRLYSISEEYGTPLYIYNQKVIENSIKSILEFPNAFGLKVRYAVKANSNLSILRIFNNLGLHFDASSEYEVEKLLYCGVEPEKISLVCQELPTDLMSTIHSGVQFIASSLHQLEMYAELFASTSVGIRINIGMGSGSFSKTTVGGPSASFGIWYELLGEVKAICEEHSLTIDKIHCHIGSGNYPNKWVLAAETLLGLVENLPDVKTIDMGGGFKISRYREKETECDILDIGNRVKEKIIDFYNKTGRQIQIEIEPGTYLMARAGIILCKVIDIARTSEYEFVKLNTGMTEIIRPCLYGAWHNIITLPKRENKKKYVFVGHCCESSDLISPSYGNGDKIDERISGEIRIGDLCIIKDAGAYCSSMCTKNYNFFPESAELLLNNEENILIRRKQTFAQMIQNEDFY
ncbi:unnamed protein product [Blepharisma stoltei]|uniref:Orn/DAP/Arg decarboxylase 2 N-terminal domain-containing protein n=1 Tax=Blepharisma stoltei TaxID=1481888 RepID=A0AAU9JT01_9CILI|nr:unnamed protein product [Blepharisma stoltei]